MLDQDERFYEASLRGAKLRGYPVPTRPFGDEIEMQVNVFESDADGKMFHFTGSVVGVVRSVVCFRDSYAYKVVFEQLPELLKVNSWGAVPINKLRSKNKFYHWVSFADGDR